jgi:glycosyltransferase involved in cell wall biosynthesis
VQSSVVPHSRQVARCPDLSALPSPPRGRAGWPWTEASAQLPERMPTGERWPRVSVVTPSYNQAPFLEATLRSVLLQGYPDLEYIVVDGGSVDESTEILRRYEPWLTDWVSERDEGQSQAINKGFERTTGEVLAWLNSDDLYEPNALARMAQYLADTPDCALLYGRGWNIDEEGLKTGSCDWIRPFDRRLFLSSNFILQPAAFWRRWLWEQAGELDVSYHWAMDWDWLIRATALTQPHYLPVALASWRTHPGIKTVSGGEARRAEIVEISRRHGGAWQATQLVYLLDRAAWRAAKLLGNGRTYRLLERLAVPLRWLLKEVLWKNRYQR